MRQALRANQDGWIGRAALAAFLVYVAAVFVLQAAAVLDRANLHEELRLLFGYHRAGDPGLFAGDYLAAFVGALHQPLLYDAITRLWVGAGGDLLLLHRLLPLVCWVAFLGGIGVAARRLGDGVTIAGAVGLAVVQPLYLYQITSALPHAFAFPLLIWAFVALLRGSSWGLAATTLLAGLLYPALAPLVGLLLAWQILIDGRLRAAAHATKAKHLLLLAVTGGLTLWLLYDSLRGTAQFGAALAPLQATELYPENGPGGRYFYGVFNPVTYVAAKAFAQFKDDFDTFKLFLLFAYGIVGLYGLVALLREGTARRALVAFLVCSFVLITVVLIFRPYLLYRFILYPLLTVMPLLLAVGLQQFFRRLAGAVRFPVAAALATFLVFALALDSVDAKKIGYIEHVGADEARVLSFAAAQPQDTLFAAWPSGTSTFEFIPYLTRRPLFVMIKAHYPTYEDHILEMRTRTDALIDAYLATETEPLESLYCLWQVDYLIVDKAHFRAGAERPRHFLPFDTRIEAIWATHRVGDFLLGHPDPAAVALETGDYLVVRLQAIAEAAQGGAAASCRSS